MASFPLSNSEAYKQRIGGTISSETRLVQYVELNTMIDCDTGCLIPENCWINHVPGPSVTTTYSYWGIKNEEDVSLWLEYEVWLFLDRETDKVQECLDKGVIDHYPRCKDCLQNILRRILYMQHKKEQKAPKKHNR